MIKRRFASCLTLVALCFLPAAASQAIFLEVSSPNISGDSITMPFVGQIELSSFSQGGANAACSGGKGQGIFGEVTITKSADSATVDMLQGLAIKTVYDDMYVRFASNAGGGVLDWYLEYRFTNGIFSSYSIADTSNSGTSTEVWTLSFSKIDITYRDCTSGCSGGETVVLTPAACVGQ